MRTLVLILVILACSTAHADEASDREEARTAFAAGQAADRRGEWQEAIEHYLRANDLVPHPNAMFNIATDYERIGKLREAAVWYERYVAAAPASTDRTKIARTMRELATRSGTLTVRSTPSGARVLIDGRFAGVTPYSDPVGGGGHRVTLEHEAEREAREVRIEYGEPAVLEVTFRGPAGTLRVTGNVTGARVEVDGVRAGTLPLATSVAPGEHSIRVIGIGHAPYETMTTIIPNQETVVDAQLAPTAELTSTRPKLGYLLALGGGADLRGEGGVGLFDLGMTVLQFDFAVRIGKSTGLTTIDVVGRFAITKARLAPYVGAGYTVVTQQEPDGGPASGRGYTLLGGLRYDLTRNERLVTSIVIESGIRGNGDLEPGFVVPLMASFQISGLYRTTVR
jgi:hypothetical protein